MRGVFNLINLAETVVLVKKWAKNVGELQKEKLKEASFEVNTKSTATDLVTEIDLLSEKMIRKEIEKNIPITIFWGKKMNTLITIVITLG